MSFVLKSAHDQLLIVEGSLLTIISERGALDSSGIRRIPLEKIDFVEVKAPDSQIGFIRFYLRRAGSTGNKCENKPQRQFSVKFNDDQSLSTALKIQQLIKNQPPLPIPDQDFITSTLKKWEKYREEGILSDIEMRARLKKLMAVNS